MIYLKLSQSISSRTVAAISSFVQREKAAAFESFANVREDLKLMMPSIVDIRSGLSPASLSNVVRD